MTSPWDEDDLLEDGNEEEDTCNPIEEDGDPDLLDAEEGCTPELENDAEELALDLEELAHLDKLGITKDFEMVEAASPDTGDWNFDTPDNPLASEDDDPNDPDLEG